MPGFGRCTGLDRTDLQRKVLERRGKSTDGLIVTLGCHDTEKAAQAEAEKLLKQGFYRDVTVERIKPAEDPERPGA